MGVLRNLKTTFPDFTITRYSELIIILSLSKAISTKLDDLSDPDEIDGSKFGLVSLDNVIELETNFYIYENQISFEDSIFYFAKEQYDKLEKYLESKMVSPLLLFSLLSKIGSSTPLSGKNYALIKSSQSAYQKRIASFLIFHILSDGQEVYPPRNYTTATRNSFKDLIKIENEYQQFQDTFNVINEYNCSRDVISKFLKLYQVIEDYMYKSQLVKFQHDNDGKLFSLRDFKRMNAEISKNELDSLKLFNKKVFHLLYNPSLTVHKYIWNTWRALITVFTNNNEINEVLKQFKISRIYPSSEKEIDVIYSEIVYAIRNSIVHNKTTEFHLTYSSINPKIYTFLERFLIPTLEDLIFFLTSNKPNLVWFEHPELKVWED